MEEMSYQVDRVWNYFQQDEGFRFCSGSKAECNELKGDGYIEIPWDANVSKLDIKRVKLLDMVPGKAVLKKPVLPDFLGGLDYLENLVLDLNFLWDLKPDQLPESLKSLTLKRNLEYDDVVEDLSENQVSWNDKVILPNLKALRLVADDEKTGVIGSISSKQFPALRFLGFGLWDETELEVFENFKALTDVELMYLEDFNVFNYLKHLPLVSIDLGGMNKKFDISGLAELKNVEMVSLNSQASELDCKIFTKLKALREITILNSKKIANIESLLECPKLESVEFLDCGNPFKKGIDKKFYNHGFKRLEIDFA